MMHNDFIMKGAYVSFHLHSDYVSCGDRYRQLTEAGGDGEYEEITIPDRLELPHSRRQALDGDPAD